MKGLRSGATWLLLVSSLAGCARQPGPERGGSAPAPLAPDGLRAVTVYFSDSQAEHLVAATRYVNPDSGLARETVRMLLAGPDIEERARGLTTAVPAETRLLGIAIHDSTAIVDLSRSFESGGGSASIRARLAQLTFTLTKLRGIAQVKLHLDGRPVEVFSGEGLDVSRPLVRRDSPDLAPVGDDEPPVVITEPVPGSVVGDTVVVRGQANVFEANVGLRVRDASGREVLETYTTATCGTGCRGSFEKRLALPAGLTGSIVIEAFAPSAKDGSDMHRVSTRVRRVIGSA